MSSAFWVGLKQRKLVQWSAAYAAGAFALIQVLDVVAQRFGWPDRLEKLVILVLAIGFFVALVLAWYHGERGAQKVGGVELLIIALLLAIGGGALWAYARTPRVAVTPALAAAPKPLEPQTAAASAIVPSPAFVPEKSVAVLPFANESGNKDEQFFSDGLSDDLITALSQFAGLKVISRNSAFQFRDSRDSSTKIGKLLGVAHLLEGSVQRAGDEVRITAMLVNASDGSIVWSQRYDKPYKDLFALQDDITRSVADALKARLLTAPGAVVQSDRPPSGDLDAYTAYQRGVAYNGTEADTRKAIDAFSDAIRRDPKYAAAYAQSSRAWMGLVSQYLTDPSEIAQAGDAARKAAATALKLDSGSSLAHVAHAYVLEVVDMDWAGAEAEYRRALQLAPNDATAQFGLGHILAVLGQNRRGAELMHQALDSDPRHTNWYYWLGSYRAALGDLDAARKAQTTAIAMHPDAASFHEALALIEILRGDAKAALAAAQQETDASWREIALALALQIGPDRKAADAALAQLTRHQADVAAYQIAQVHALRRDPDGMFQWLDRARANGDSGISSLLSDPLILRYRNDPRFAAFCRKVGLPTTTDAVAMK